MHLTSSETMGWIKMAYREFSKLKLYIESHMLPPRGVVWLAMRNIEELMHSLTNPKSVVITLQMVKIVKPFVTLQTKDFIKIQNNPQHVLYQLLPDKKQTTYDLRRRGHDFNLPVKADRNFINRSLYNFI